MPITWDNWAGGPPPLSIGELKPASQMNKFLVASGGSTFDELQQVGWEAIVCHFFDPARLRNASPLTDLSALGSYLVQANMKGR